MQKAGILSVIIVSFVMMSSYKECQYRLPERGLCAHRGAMETHPENTLPAFRAAVEAGAHMMEFDVWLTKDNQMVVIHDSDVDRTTDGKGKISALTLAQIRELDAGGWKSADFKGTKVPVLQEVLDEMPVNIWLNIHIKEDGKLAEMVALLIKEQGRLHQTLLACRTEAAERARKVVPGIKICNMERQDAVEKYIAATIFLSADFIQLQKKSAYNDFPACIRQLKENGIKVNYYGTDSPAELRYLFDTGVDFPLVNDIVHTMPVAQEMGIKPVIPIMSCID